MRCGDLGLGGMVAPTDERARAFNLRSRADALYWQWRRAEDHARTEEKAMERSFRVNGRGSSAAVDRVDEAWEKAGSLRAQFEELRDRADTAEEDNRRLDRILASIFEDAILAGLHDREDDDGHD